MDTALDSFDSSPPIRDFEVVAWRRDQLLATGFDPTLAEQLAHDCGVDLHDVLELVEHGCVPQLAARIVAPAEGEHRVC
jgi:hypothetical protein